MEECILEDGPEQSGAEESNGKSSKSKSSSNGTSEKEDPTASLIFRVSHKVAYKTLLKGITQNAILYLHLILISFHF